MKSMLLVMLIVVNELRFLTQLPHLPTSSIVRFDLSTAELKFTSKSLRQAMPPDKLAFLQEGGVSRYYVTKRLKFRLT